MWLTKNGNIRMDLFENGRYVISRWNAKYNNWLPWATNVTTVKAMRFARDMMMTEYPDIPEGPPDMTGV